MHKEAISKNIYGLVLAGGKSRRMNTDKSLLNYHGTTQIEYSFALLSNFCDKVFISNRKDQSDFPAQKNYPQIHDQNENIGPLGGILSAMVQHPDVAWLVLACDLPFVDTDVISRLIQARDPAQMATVYRSAVDKKPEPLCAIYEPEITRHLNEFLNNGVHCPRKILMNLAIHEIDQNGGNALENINNPQEYQNALSLIRKKIIIK